MAFLATINVPGFLPTDDDPPVFATTAEAWAYLLDEYVMAWNDVEVDGTPEAGLPEPLASQYRANCHNLTSLASRIYETGTVYVETPGYDGDHDLGLAYSVSVAEGE